MCLIALPICVTTGLTTPIHIIMYLCICLFSRQFYPKLLTSEGEGTQRLINSGAARGLNASNLKILKSNASTVPVFFPSVFLVIIFVLS